MGGYTQSTFLNNDNCTSSCSKKGVHKNLNNDKKLNHRSEINKKRLHDGILRFGILKMWNDIEGSFQNLQRSTKKMLFGINKSGVTENDSIDIFCEKIGKALHVLHLKR